MTSARRTGTLLAVLAALALAPWPAAADWLVTRDGGKIETKGPWKVDGRRILFTMPNGTLSSVRAEEIDLDLSAAETARALQAKTAPAPEPPRKEPVLRLTEKEIPPMKAEGEEEGADGKKPEEAAGSQLEVTNWEKTESPTGDGIEIFGTLRNGSTSNITSPSLMVMLYDADGGLVATNSATLSESILMAGKSCNFRVAFPGVADFAAVKWDPAGRGFRTRTGGPAEGEEGTIEEEAPADQELPVEEAAPQDTGAAPEGTPPPGV